MNPFNVFCLFVCLFVCFCVCGCFCCFLYFCFLYLLIEKPDRDRQTDRHRDTERERERRRPNDASEKRNLCVCVCVCARAPARVCAAPSPTKNPVQDNLCYKCITRTAAPYLCNCLQFYTPSRTLRPADILSLQIPRTLIFLSTLGSRAFSVFGPTTRNARPLPLRQKPSLDSFRSNPKT